MTARTGSVDVSASFPHGTDETFGLLFNDDIFVEQQKADNRLDISVVAGWAAGDAPNTYIRRTTYGFGESAVLRQGTSTVTGKEVATRVDGGWTVNVTLDNNGGALASSTKVNAVYKITAKGAEQTGVVCTVNFSYDLASVSWMLRAAVESVVYREMRGAPEKLFKLAEGRNIACAGFVKDLAGGSTAAKEPAAPLTVPAPKQPSNLAARRRSASKSAPLIASGRLAPRASAVVVDVADLNDTPEDQPYHAVPVSPQSHLSHRSSSRVSSPVHHPDARMTPGTPISDSLDRSGNAAKFQSETNTNNSSMDSVEMLKPMSPLTRGARLSKRKTRALILVAIILALWWCAAMIGARRHTLLHTRDCEGAACDAARRQCEGALRDGVRGRSTLAPAGAGGGVGSSGALHPRATGARVGYVAPEGQCVVDAHEHSVSAEEAALDNAGFDVIATAHARAADRYAHALQSTTAPRSGSGPGSSTSAARPLTTSGAAAAAAPQIGRHGCVVAHTLKLLQHHHRQQADTYKQALELHRKQMASDEQNAPHRFVPFGRVQSAPVHGKYEASPGGLAVDAGNADGRNGELLRSGATGLEGFWEASERMFAAVFQEHRQRVAGGGADLPADHSECIPLSVVQGLFNNMAAAKNRYLAQQRQECDETRQRLRAAELRVSAQHEQIQKYQQKWRQIQAVKERERERKEREGLGGREGAPPAAAAATAGAGAAASPTPRESARQRSQTTQPHAQPHLSPHGAPRTPSRSSLAGPPPKLS